MTGCECKATRKLRNIFLFLDVHSTTNYGAIAGVGIIRKKRRKDWRKLWTVFPTSFSARFSLLPRLNIESLKLCYLIFNLGLGCEVQCITLLQRPFPPPFPSGTFPRHNKRTSFTSISEGGTKLVTGNQYQSPGPRNALISSVCGFPFLENGSEHRKFYDNC